MEHAERSAPAPQPGAEDPTDLSVREALSEILGKRDLEPSVLESELKRLEEDYKEAVYSELLHLLANVRIDHEEARLQWQRIAEHRQSMQQRLGDEVDLQVALLDYFVRVMPRLQNPKIVEMKLFEQTQAAVYRDELTGLYNYRFLGEQLPREMARCAHKGEPLSLLVLDVDDFKNYNDRNGHECGSRALATISRLLNEELRADSVAVRYGGEEFTLILPATTKPQAQTVGDRIRKRIERHRFPDVLSREGRGLTVSIGIATYPADAEDHEELLRRADSAMYIAKAGGKNRVKLYGQSTRSHARVQAPLSGSFRVLAGESHPLTTVTVGGGGLLVVADSELNPGALIEIDLKLPPDDQTVTVLGRVIHARKRDNGCFEVGVMLEEDTRENRSVLGRFVRDAT